MEAKQAERARRIELRDVNESSSGSLSVPSIQSSPNKKSSHYSPIKLRRSTTDKSVRSSVSTSLESLLAEELPELSDVDKTIPQPFGGIPDSKEITQTAIDNEEKELALAESRLERHATMAMIRYDSGNNMAAIISARQVKIFEDEKLRIEHRLTALRDLLTHIETKDPKPYYVRTEIRKILQKIDAPEMIYADDHLLQELENGNIRKFVKEL